MSTVAFEPVAVPLHEDPAGVFRVGTSRVLLEVVLHAFQAGATPEAIVQSYDTLSLADVYAVVSSYVAHPAAMDEYLARRDEAAAAVRGKIEAGQRSADSLRELIKARARAKGLLSDQPLK